MMADADEIPAMMRKLGLRFWLLWWLSLGLLCAGFVSGLLFLIANGMWSFWTGTAVTLAFGIGVIGLSMTPYFAMRKANPETKLREPQRRYMARFLPAMFAYVLVLTPAITFFQQAKPEGIL